MKNKWKTIRLGLMLFALPLVATAAASAHQWIVESNPITIELNSEVGNESAIGLARVHTVALNRNGAVEGRIAAIDAGTKTTAGLSSLKVFFVQEGKVVSETATQEDGSFVAQDLAEGVYSFIATGENGFAAYGVRVVANGNDKVDNVMEAAAVSPRFDAVKKILNDRLPAEVSQQILESSKIGSDVKVVGSNRVRLDEGTLVGHVVAILGGQDAVNGTFVHILQNDKQIAEVQADESGSFMISDLEPGIYDFVAAGPTGFAAVSFEAVQDQEEGSVVDLIDSEELPVSAEPFVPGVVADPIAYQDAIPADIPYGAGYSDSLDVCLTCQQDSGFVGEQVNYAGTESYVDPGYAPIEYAGESIGCGCASGGCCGAVSDFSGYSSCGGGCGAGYGAGGGGSAAGVGGRGLGRLLAIAGLTVGIIALADNGDGGGTTPPPASPANP